MKRSRQIALAFGAILITPVIIIFNHNVTVSITFQRKQDTGNNETYTQTSIQQKRMTKSPIKASYTTSGHVEHAQNETLHGYTLTSTRGRRLTTTSRPRTTRRFVRTTTRPNVISPNSGFTYCDKDVCPQTIKRKGVWQYYQDDARKGIIYAFNAFYDSREGQIRGIYTVRIFGISSSSRDNDIFCQLWFQNSTVHVTVKASVKDTGRGLKFAQTKYQERIYTCTLPSVLRDRVPESVSLHRDPCGQSTMLLSVQNPDRNQVHDIGLCVVVAYGRLDPIRLVEWIELNLLLGVGEINVYDSRINPEARQIFEHYSQKDDVKIHQSSPVVDSWCTWCQKLSVIPMLNDCMYRNMYRYKHLAVIDFDEVIIPKLDTNLHDLIQRLQGPQEHPVKSFMFRNAYFFSDFEPKSTSQNYLHTARYKIRTAVSKIGYAAKSIINPRQCLVMQNHYCMEKMQGLSYRYVDPSIALLQHYKKCHLGKTECDKMLKTPQIDNSISQYTDDLRSRVLSVLEILNITVT